jgi:drug/metabolite transporter (DMT)-like permease
MNLEALALIVTGALLHAAWNLFAKKASGGVPFVWLFGLVSVACAAPVGLIAWFHNPQPLSGKFLAVIVASAAVHVLYSIVLQKGYQKSDFSLVYPLARGTGPLFSVIAAVLFFREMPGVVGWLGIAAILAGIVLIAGLPQLLRNTDDRLPTGILWGTMTGIAIATYTVIDGYAVKVLGMAPVIYYVLGLALRTALLAPVALRSPQLLKEQWSQHRHHIIAVGVLSPLAYTLVLYAMVRAPLSYVAPVRELSMLAGAYLGARLLQERYLFSRMVGTALMVVGVILLVKA